MSAPNPACLPQVRDQIAQGLATLQSAADTLRENGWPENADAVMRTVRHGRVWTQSDGWLDHLEKP